MLILTHSLIEHGTKTDTCDGLNKAQCVLLGMEWPPTKGWKHRLVGTEISDCRYEKFIAVRGPRGGSNPGMYLDIVGSRRKPKAKKQKQKKQKPAPLPPEIKEPGRYSEQYYKTPLWARIRELVFLEKGKRCWICKDSANVVHHQKYNRAVMRGDDRRHLFPLCNSCHQRIHFEEGGERRKNWVAYFDKQSLIVPEDCSADCCPDRMRGFFNKLKNMSPGEIQLQRSSLLDSLFRDDT